MFDLTGMTALVTGASGGIGSAIAQALAAQGARLALSGSNAAKLRAFREELNRRASSGDHVEITCDLSNTTQVEELVPAAVDTLGKLDILVNNAGITRDNLAMRMKDEEWDAVIRINLEAAFRLMRAAARPMMKARFGRIVTDHQRRRRDRQSGAGQLRRGQGRADRRCPRALAQELASRGITVNCVAPGFIRTAMTDSAARRAEGRAQCAASRWAGWARATTSAPRWPISPAEEAGYVTGQTLHVNGGMAMLGQLSRFPQANSGADGLRLAASAPPR